MVDMHHQLGPDGSGTVSALGLRWAALRGMLSSALMEADEHQALRADLVRELSAIERDLAGLAARNGVEVVAKIDVVQSALRQAGIEDAVAQLLESVKADTLALLPVARPRPERSNAAQILRSPTWPVATGSESNPGPDEAADQGAAGTH